jgi:uncharacterized protein YbaR (Trm112 family)
MNVVDIMKISPNLLEKLACPVCKKKLQYEEDLNRLVCTGCKLSYPIVNDVPVLLAEEAEKLNEESTE